MLDPEPVEVFPRKNPGVVQIVEFDAHGIIADRLQIHDPDMSASSDNRLLARPVALHLGRRALDPEIFGGEAEFFAVVERDLEPLGGALQAQFDRPGFPTAWGRCRRVRPYRPPDAPANEPANAQCRVAPFSSEAKFWPGSTAAISTNAIKRRARSSRSGASSSACFSLGTNGQSMAIELIRCSPAAFSIASQSAEIWR